VIRRLILAAALAGALVWPLTAAAQKPTGPMQAAAAWLRTQQQTDGGFSNSFTPGSDPGATADAVLAIAALGESPADWAIGGKSPQDFLEQSAASGSIAGAGALAKVALAAVAAGANVRSFGGVDLIAGILGDYSEQVGLFGTGPFDSALALQALTEAGEPAPEGAVAGLLATRLDDGTYSFNGDMTPGAGDSNTTAMAVLALIAVGQTQETAPSVEYFRSAQNDDGGWTYQKPSAFGEATDANSTALVMQALVAAGEDLAAWNDPAQALLALQIPSGAFIFNAATSSENLLATVQALPALALILPQSAAAPAGTPWLAIGLGVVGVVIVAVAAARVLRKRAAEGRVE
jgi:hypothetical protein